MKPIARFVVRPDGEAQSLLLLGIAKADTQALEPGFVYEIRDFDGELVLSKVGPSCIGPVNATPEERQRESWLLSWGCSADGLITRCGKWLVATLSEWQAYRAKCFGHGVPIAASEWDGGAK